MADYIIRSGSTDVSVVLFIFDPATGLADTSVVFNTSGIDLRYRREGAAAVTITEATLAALTTAHTDGGFLHIGNGYYRLDLPDAAVASGASGVLVFGGLTSRAVVGSYIQLVAYDPQDTVRLGLTALPNVASGSAGAIPTTGTGSNQLSVSSGHVTLADGSLAAAKFAAGAITATVIATDAIDADAIADNAINAAAIASDAITAAKVADGTIDANTFATGAITAASIASDAITAAKIAAGAIEADAFAANAITAASIASDAITAAKIATGAIDADALATDAVTEIQSGLSTLGMSTALPGSPTADTVGEALKNASVGIPQSAAGASGGLALYDDLFSVVAEGTIDTVTSAGDMLISTNFEDSDGFYTGMFLVPQSGDAAKQPRAIAVYTGSTRRCQFTGTGSQITRPFSVAPSVGDPIKILGLSGTI